jgi:hypothetical protein
MHTARLVLRHNLLSLERMHISTLWTMHLGQAIPWPAATVLRCPRLFHMCSPYNAGPQGRGVRLSTKCLEFASGVMTFLLLSTR